MSRSTFFGVQRRKKERPDLSFMFTNSLDYGGWGRVGEYEDASPQKKKKKKKRIF